MKRVAALGALLLAGCPTLSVVGTQCVNGSCEVAGYPSNGLVCVGGFCVVPNDGGGGGASCTPDLSCANAPGGCEVNGNDQQPESFCFDADRAALALGRFGATAGFVLADRNGNLYAFEARPSKTFWVRKVAGLSAGDYGVVTIPGDGGPDGFATLRLANGSLVGFRPEPDGGYAALALGSGVTAVAAGRQGLTGVVVSIAGADLRLYRATLAGDDTNSLGPSWGFNRGCLFEGRLLGTTAPTGSGQESEVLDLPENAMGVKRDGGTAWTHCAPGTQNQAFVTRADGGIDAYQLNLGIASVCPVRLTDGGFAASDGPLARATFNGAQVLLAASKDGVTQFALTPGNACEATQTAREGLGADGGYRLIAAGNLDNANSDDLVLLTGGLLRIDWR